MHATVRNCSRAPARHPALRARGGCRSRFSLRAGIAGAILIGIFNADRPRP